MDSESTFMCLSFWWFSIFCPGLWCLLKSILSQKHYFKLFPLFDCTLLPLKQYKSKGIILSNHLNENEDLRLWVQSPAAHASNFSTPDCKIINKSLSVRVIVICSDHKLLCSTLIKVLIAHQHCLSLYCTRLLSFWA